MYIGISAAGVVALGLLMSGLYVLKHKMASKRARILGPQAVNLLMPNEPIAMPQPAQMPPPAQPAYAAAALPIAPPPVAPTFDQRLENLERLKAKGLLSEAEYSAKRDEVLADL